ncbi:SurA N-terminal domain-containing protein [Thioalkalivibrio sp. HK1]|uniref:SurA N-terminal domain-containing protein n=1 Tax=Thioalkalivibrio sp. HK1 TaxID=1469245 RepID=UPI0004B1DF34|nr:SurA N-terminal domain-containing protein [Thioalkalivibrio sp. HK1]
MLQFIRDKATGWVAWAIVIMLTIPFALWGVHQYYVPPEGGYQPVAIVNGDEISYYTLRGLYDNRRQQMRRSDPNAYLTEEEQAAERRDILDELIDYQVIIDTGSGAGMRVSDVRLSESIREGSGFRSGGEFSREVYENVIRNQGISVGQYEEDLRESFLQWQVVSGIVGAGFISSTELNDYLRIEGQKRDFSLLTLPVIEPDDGERTDEESLDEAAIQAHFEDNGDTYIVPERVRLRYVEISRDEIAAAIDTDDEELRAHYETRKREFVTEETRNVSHILISLPSDADDEAEEKAKEDLVAIRDRIVAGESFEDLATELSQDPGSAQSGGDLGVVERGVMDASFEAAAFALDADALSDPVRSLFGWHLIKVTAINEKQVTPFEEVREQLLEEYRQREAEDLYAENVDTLANLSYENPESLEVAADELGLEIKESDYIGRSGPISDPEDNDSSAISHPRILEAAFSEDVLEGGNNSDMIEYEPGKVVVLRTFDRQAERRQSLDEVRQEVIDSLEAERAKDRIVMQGRRILADLRGGKDPKEVAEEVELEWSVHEGVERSSFELSEMLIEAAFRIPRPEAEDAPQFDGIYDPDTGEYLLISLSAVIDGDSDAMEEAQRDTTKERLEGEIGQGMYDAFLSSRRKVAHIEIFEENIDGDLASPSF